MSDPTPLNPQARLASRRWRIVNSWWILPPIISLGFLGWLGFMVAAIQTGKKNYWIFCGLYAAALIAFIAMVSINSGDGLVSDLAFIPLLACWLGATVHAALLNRGYLRALAVRRPWYGTAVPQSTEPAGQENSSFLGVSTAEYYSGSKPTKTPSAESASGASLPRSEPYGHPPANATSPTDPASTGPKRDFEATAPVSVGAATIDTLAALPGISAALAKRIIDVRNARGGYRDLDDLASAASLRPHEIVRLRDHLTFDTTETQNKQDLPGGSGRILDI